MFEYTLGELLEDAQDLVNQHGEEVLDMPVFSTSDYGDHCHTTQLNRFCSLQLHVPKETPYSETGKCVTGDTIANRVDEDVVVVLMDGEN
jgi:hypothetical protein